MKAQVRSSIVIFVLAVLLVITLTSCAYSNDTSVVPTDETTDNPEKQPSILGPEDARDVALAYIRTYHPDDGPTNEAFWFEETSPSDDLVGSSTFQYRYENWLVTVTYPVVAPQETIYTVTVERTTPMFLWQGIVDAYGQVAETSVVRENPTATAAPPTATATVTIPPTDTPLPTTTPLPTATPTPVSTSTPTSTPTATVDPNPCNAAEFVEDITIQDGTTFAPSSDFTKVWRLKNVGTCTWTTDYDLVFVDGHRMDGNRAQALPQQVKPGESADISVNLEAPREPGDYQGLWMLRDAGGVLFGLGDKADKSFWVSIAVTDFNEGDYTYDFALDYCAATWRSDTGRLPCPGFTNSDDGFVILMSKADLENRKEDEPLLQVHPNEERYGWIEGTYPAYKIQDGDHFKAWVGCMFGYDRCSLVFYLDYIDEAGKLHSLGEWTETYDGEVSEIDIDLSDLAGEHVRFVLGVEANTKNVEDALGFWFAPRIP